MITISKEVIMIKVLFVCLGNICRSPMAEFILKDMVKKAQNKRVFTEKELAKYNGRNGEKSYVAVNGIVYDVTNVPKWRGGNHYGVKAGQVLDKEFLQCHLGKSDILENITYIVNFISQMTDKTNTKEN